MARYHGCPRLIFFAQGRLFSARYFSGVVKKGLNYYTAHRLVNFVLHFLPTRVKYCECECVAASSQ